MEQFLNKFSLHGNWVDLVFILITIYFILTNQGFISTLVEAAGFFISLFASYKFYQFFGQFLILNFSLPKGISEAAGFFIAWFLAETIFYLLVSKFFYKILKKIEKHPLNISLGFVAAIVQSSFLFLFIVSLIFSLPVRGQIKQDILDSRTGPFFVNLSQSFEKNLKNIFGEAVSETLNFLTIKPGSNESISLGSKLNPDKLSYDAKSETIMLNLVNQERTSRGIKALQFDYSLRDLGRAYGLQMFENGFFSHVSAVDGSTPAERAQNAGISFYVIGENLAFAPDVYIAHQGLMNSPGHRANILSTDFGKVGIGVVDGGIYGKIFVQEFTN